MYDEQQPFTSDLMNSYAWDTAITFIQKCTDKTTGTTNDNPCNIFDMASNVREWTTETCSFSGLPCVYRGGDCGSSFCTSSRSCINTSIGYDDIGFRPLLYL